MRCKKNIRSLVRQVEDGCIRVIVSIKLQYYDLYDFLSYLLFLCSPGTIIKLIRCGSDVKL